MKSKWRHIAPFLKNETLGSALKCNSDILFIGAEIFPSVVFQENT